MMSVRFVFFVSITRKLDAAEKELNDRQEMLEQGKKAIEDITEKVDFKFTIILILLFVYLLHYKNRSILRFFFFLSL